MTQAKEAFEVDANAKMSKVKPVAATIDSTKVLVFIDHKSKVVYLWRGKHASISERLMGTKVAARLSHAYPKYRIRPITEGHEPSSFFNMLGIKRP